MRWRGVPERIKSSPKIERAPAINAVAGLLELRMNVSLLGKMETLFPPRDPRVFDTSFPLLHLGWILEAKAMARGRPWIKP